MVVEQKILFENIWELFKNKEYFNAEKQFLAIATDNQSSEESISYANYMIGCINTTFYNKDKKQHIARDALLRCIESKYPIPMAYLMFSDIEEDKNVAVNYLKVALQQFPVSPTIYKGLLKHTIGSEKVKYIDEIDSKNIMDKQLLDTVMDFLIEEKNWAKVEGILQKSLCLKDLSDEHKLYYTLLYAFSMVAQNKNIDIAKHDFKNIMQQDDLANRLNYSHHMGYL